MSLSPSMKRPSVNWKRWNNAPARESRSHNHKDNPMRFHSQLLTDSEKEQIHKETLRILGETGVLFHSEKALRLLEANGARVDWDKNIAHIPPELVQQALKT